jgi:hypothetical protein
VPEWLIAAVSTLLVMALVAVSWTLWQGASNLRAVKSNGGDDDLAEFAASKVLRLSTLWISTAAGVAIGMIAMFTSPSSPIRVASRIGMVILVLGLVGIAFHEYRDMVKQIREGGQRAEV